MQFMNQLKGVTQNLSKLKSSLTFSVFRKEVFENQEYKTITITFLTVLVKLN